MVTLKKWNACTAVYLFESIQHSTRSLDPRPLHASAQAIGDSKDTCFDSDRAAGLTVQPAAGTD